MDRINKIYEQRKEATTTTKRRKMWNSNNDWPVVSIAVFLWREYTTAKRRENEKLNGSIDKHTVSFIKVHCMTST